MKAAFLIAGRLSSIIMKYRYYKAKKENMPLLVYFCSSASVGNDNILPSIEVTRIRKIFKQGFNILLPQPPRKINKSIENDDFERAINSYVAEVKAVIDNVDGYDKKKVYIVGTSLGGYCVWRMIYNYPNLCAGAVSVVGGYYYKLKKGIFDFSKIKTPLWFAHSSNDKTVSVEMDDYAFDQLSLLEADIKYTRWDKYGHNMSNRFYKREDWDKWLIEKHLP